MPPQSDGELHAQCLQVFEGARVEISVRMQVIALDDTLTGKRWKCLSLQTKKRGACDSRHFETILDDWNTVRKCMRIAATPVRNGKDRSKPQATGVVSNEKAVATIESPKRGRALNMYSAQWSRWVARVSRPSTRSEVSVDN